MMETETNSERMSFSEMNKEIFFLSTSAMVIYVESKPIIELISEVVNFTTTSRVTVDQLCLFIPMVLIETFIKSSIMKIILMCIFSTIFSFYLKS